MNADFAGAKICPAADACRSSNRTLSGTGIVLNIEKLDKDFKSTNFHSKRLENTEHTPHVGGMIKKQHLVDKAKCHEKIRELRWPDGVCRPHCGSKAITKQGKLKKGWQ